MAGALGCHGYGSQLGTRRVTLTFATDDRALRCVLNAVANHRSSHPAPSPMAARSTRSADAGRANYQIDAVSVKEATDTLRGLRAGRGGRSSKYQPILDGIRELRRGQVLRVGGVGRTEVNALRAYLFRYLDRDQYRLKSARDRNSDTFTVVAGRTEDFEK